MPQVPDEQSSTHHCAREPSKDTPGGGRRRQGPRAARGWEEGRKAQGGREGGREGGLQQLLIFNWFCRSPVGKDSVVHAPVRCACVHVYV